MSRARAATALLVLGLAGCGPHIPLDLGVQEVPLNILLGAQAPGKSPTVVTVLLPGGNPFFVPTTQPQLLEPGVAPSPSPPPVACPTAPPGTDPVVPASPDLLGEPQPGIYAYRQNGTWQPDTKTPQTFAFPTAGITTVSKPVPVATVPTGPTSEYNYSVTDVPSGSDGAEQVRTDFLVVPQNVTESAPGGQVVTQAAGIFLQGIMTTGPKATTFRPVPAITYLNLPVAVGISWTSSGTDPTTGTTMQLSGTVETSDQTHKTGRFRVDACGQVYDTWEVHATGTLVGPGVNVTLDWHYDIATQFGGLQLRHTLSEGGAFQGPADPTQGLSQVTQVINSINPKPAAP
jgi:hypothetical protein